MCENEDDEKIRIHYAFENINNEVWFVTDVFSLLAPIQTHSHIFLFSIRVFFFFDFRRKFYFPYTFSQHESWTFFVYVLLCVAYVHCPCLWAK